MKVCTAALVNFSFTPVNIFCSLISDTSRKILSSVSIVSEEVWFFGRFFAKKREGNKTLSRKK